MGDPPVPKLHLVVVAALLFFSSAVGSQEEPLRISGSAIRLPTEEGDGGGLCSGAARPGSCPVKCFRADPVCGVDGVTYWCGCADAACSGVGVAKLGYCEVGSGGSGPLSGQALLLVHIVWLIVLGFSVLFGLF